MVRNYTICPVRSAEDLDSIRYLFTAYTQWLDLDLTFQGFADELANLPGKYCPPSGELLLAKDDEGQPLGCVAIRSLSLTTRKCCEMKRLYTSPSARGLGLGRALVTRILAIASDLGYDECRLDTLPRMEAAIALYESVGFERCEGYYDTPLLDTVFLRCDLRGWRQRGR